MVRNFRTSTIAVRKALNFHAKHRDGGATTDHRLGWILVEYVERTDKYSTLRGWSRDTGFVRIPVLILALFAGLVLAHMLAQPVTDDNFSEFETESQYDSGGRPRRVCSMEAMGELVRTH